jgi:hypothetical protein
VATQVLTEVDGRLKLAFEPGSGGQLEVNIWARKLPVAAKRRRRVAKRHKRANNKDKDKKSVKKSGSSMN